MLRSWQSYVLSEAVAVSLDGRDVLLGDHTHVVSLDGRDVLLGDHTHVVKDGGRMPGVVSMRETSETQHKPSYFRGQCWGALGVVVGTLGACFCLPLELRIHQGLVHRGERPVAENATHTTLGERLMIMALDYAYHHDRLCGRVLDAFFPSAKLFELAQSLYRVVRQQPYLQILLRAKKNYVGYYPALPKPAHRRGRQAK